MVYKDQRFYDFVGWLVGVLFYGILALFQSFNTESNYFNQNFVLIRFGFVLCHINHCRLFNAKSIFTPLKSSVSNN